MWGLASQNSFTQFRIIILQHVTLLKLKMFSTLLQKRYQLGLKYLLIKLVNYVIVDDSDTKKKRVIFCTCNKGC